MVSEDAMTLVYSLPVPLALPTTQRLSLSDYPSFVLNFT